METCMTCNGDAEVECETCEGSGTDPATNDVCEECTGLCLIECDPCGGNGTLEMPPITNQDAARTANR